MRALAAPLSTREQRDRARVNDPTIPLGTSAAERRRDLALLEQYLAAHRRRGTTPQPETLARYVALGGTLEVRR